MVNGTVGFPMMSSEELLANLDNREYRLSNLYRIVSKGDEEDGSDSLILKFVPNLAQRRLIARLWHRNLCLKARQRGITTLIAILWLDTALFSKGPIKCGIVAHERDAAEEIFRDKVLFAYNNLPDELRERFPLKTKTKTQLVFGHNGAVIRVATSLRSGTTHRLHISEFGKICAKYPAKAREVMTGSIPSVPKSGITVIESTAEGQAGEFYELTQLAMNTLHKRQPLTPKDWKFHFFAWWDAPEYELDPEGVLITPANAAYFHRTEAVIGRGLSPRKRAWYVSTLRNDFADEQPLMWQEYPSFPEEAFQVSTEGCYYAAQLADARKQRRILPSLPVEAVPVNTFWDIGRSDLCALWFHQRVGPENRFVGYYEASGEDFNHFAKVLMDKGFVYGRHFLPHDAAHKRQGLTPDTNLSPMEMLEKLMPGQRFEIVPRVTSILTGIQSTRNVFGSCWFDETECAAGLPRLTRYRKKWDPVRGCWRDEPLHDDNSNGADAFRQFGQLADAGNQFGGGGYASAARPGGHGQRRSERRNRGSGWAA